MVRGSYGLFQAPVSQFSGELANRQGFVPQFGVASIDGGVTASFNWTDGFPLNRFNPDPVIDPTVANGSATSFIGKTNAHPAQVQMLNLSIQHELPGQMLFEAAYIGNLSHHVSTGSLEQVNQLDYGKYGSLGPLLGANINSAAAINAGIKSPFPGFNGTVAQALRPYPQYLGINGITSMIGNSVYHAAQVKLQKHFSDGLSFLVGYTVSKTVADVDATPGFFAAGVQDAYNRRAERSVTSVDFPRDLVASYAYELPFGPGKRFLSGQDVFSKHVLGGWTVSGIHKYTAGSPLAITTNGRLPTTGDTLSQSNPTLRPNRVVGRGCAHRAELRRYGSGHRSVSEPCRICQPSAIYVRKCIATAKRCSRVYQHERKHIVTEELYDNGDGGALGSGPTFLMYSIGTSSAIRHQTSIT